MPGRVRAVCRFHAPCSLKLLPNESLFALKRSSLFIHKGQPESANCVCLVCVLFLCSLKLLVGPHQGIVVCIESHCTFYPRLLQMMVLPQHEDNGWYNLFIWPNHVNELCADLMVTWGSRLLCGPFFCIEGTGQCVSSSQTRNLKFLEQKLCCIPHVDLAYVCPNQLLNPKTLFFPSHTIYNVYYKIRSICLQPTWHFCVPLCYSRRLRPCVCGPSGRWEGTDAIRQRLAPFTINHIAEKPKRRKHCILHHSHHSP